MSSRNNLQLVCVVVLVIAHVIAKYDYTPNVYASREKLLTGRVG